jgi:hypothetical protein
MATHDLFRAKESGTRVGIMKHGRLLRTLATRDIGHADLERIYLDHMRDEEAAMIGTIARKELVEALRVQRVGRNQMRDAVTVGLPLVGFASRWGWARLEPRYVFSSAGV